MFKALGGRGVARRPDWEDAEAAREEVSALGIRAEEAGLLAKGLNLECEGHTARVEGTRGRAAGAVPGPCVKTASNKGIWRKDFR